ncbi:MAG: hypothetical protein QF824_02270 [Candidatus Woesearchaeota archaeon]|jgi:hypothetical protein|nr:hypothetical protein [Candidatus Woesearchaeota archaeon]
MEKLQATRGEAFVTQAIQLGMNVAGDLAKVGGIAGLVAGETETAILALGMGVLGDMCGEAARWSQPYHVERPPYVAQKMRVYEAIAEPFLNLFRSYRSQIPRVYRNSV